MTILVTGGAGFIGSNFIVDWLASSNEAVINLDSLTYAGNLHNLKTVNTNPFYSFYHGDIKDESLVFDLLVRFKVRAIVHFAAESHVDRSITGPDAFIQTNVVGTMRLLEAAKRYWLNGSCENFKFLHVSTDEVFGSLTPDAPAFREELAYEPNSPYSASKAASDHLVRAYHQTYGLPVLTTHCSNNYGPYQFPEKLIPLCIHKALSGEQLPIYGDGKQIRDWLYVSDHCSAIRQVLEHAPLGECYNVGGWNEQTNISVVQSICDILDSQLPRADGLSYATQIKYVADRLGHDRRYAIDASKIERDLNWKPVETFTTGLQKTVVWYLENQDWVQNVISGDYRVMEQSVL